MNCINWLWMIAAERPAAPVAPATPSEDSPVEASADLLAARAWIAKWKDAQGALHFLHVSIGT